MGFWRRIFGGGSKPRVESDDVLLAKDILVAKLEALRDQAYDFGCNSPGPTVDELMGYQSRRLTGSEKAEMLRQAEIISEKKTQEHLRRALEPVAKRWNRSVEDLMRLAR